MDESTRDALETVEFLAASPVRPRVLSALADGAATLQQLRERLEVPRSTLHRNLSALVDRGFVVRSASANSYALTITGEIVSEAVHETLSTVERAASLEPFLERFPGECPVAVDALADAEIVASEIEAPFDPISTVKSMVVSGDSVRGFLPVINPLYLDALEVGIENDIEIDVIAPPTAYRTLAKDAGETLEAVSRAPSIDLYESTAVPEYAVGFVDETVVVGVFDDYRRTHSVLRADSTSAIGTWAADRYAAIEDTAERFEIGHDIDNG